MSRRAYAPSGFTVVEMMITIGIIGLLTGGVLYSAAAYHGKKQAKACANNIHALYLAVNEYAIDMKKRDGDTINLNSLAPRYIPNAELFRCPTCNLKYGTNFIYGNIPVCPSPTPITNHVWKPTQAVNI